jgi:hypothetical protein
MMYLRIKDGVITYPYSVQQLKLDEYNVSFPKDLTTGILEEWGVYEVNRTPKPTDYTKNIAEGTPQLVDGSYVQSWEQSDATQSEIDERIENKWEEVRQIRNELLLECDWTQLSDIPNTTKELWQTYRQELRDITSQTNPFSIVWPVKP